MDIEQTVDAHAASPATFSILERLANRGMPTEDVTIYLDEDLGWTLAALEHKHANTTNPKQLTQLEKDIALVREQLASSKYIVHMRGMTNERYDEIVDTAIESHPYEYEETVNPLTTQRTKNVIPNEERDELFNSLFLAEAIVSIEDPSGAIDENITPEVIVMFKRLAPIDAIRRIRDTAGAMRMAAEWIEQVETADFTPKL